MAADRSPADRRPRVRARDPARRSARARRACRQLGAPFEKAVELICDCHGKLIVSGLGKSGHVGRKIAATFASTGTTAVFLHLAEAIHGDLGMAAEGDVAILISQSGETAELEPVIDHFQHAHIPIIAITGHAGTMLAEAGTAALVLPHWPEVGPESVAPTTSTTMTLALGDALAMTVMRQKGVTRTDFGRLHPGRLARRAAEAGAAADARRQVAAADARGQLDARHGRRDVRQAARRGRRDRRSTAIWSASSPTATFAATSSGARS